MVEALIQKLDVLKVPFVKELASDELLQVPNKPQPLDSLFSILIYIKKFI